MRQSLDKRVHKKINYDKFNEIFCVFLGVLSGALYTWYNYGRSYPYTVEGTLTAVDKCDRHCFTASPAPVGCIHAVAVSLHWSVGAAHYNQSGVSADSTKCPTVCCVESIGRRVKLEIEQSRPYEALSFWQVDEVAYNREPTLRPSL